MTTTASWTAAVARALRSARGRSTQGTGQAGSVVEPPEPPALPIGPVFDVTTLPAAVRQYPDWASYRTLITGLAVGNSYVCPGSGARVYRLGAGRGEYSAGGPFVSTGRVDGSLWIVWEGSSPAVSRLSRITPGVHTATTVDLSPQPSNVGLLQVAFSRVTPWLLYVLKGSGDVLSAVDVRTNTEASVPGLPINLAPYASGAWQWLTVADDDSISIFGPNTPSPQVVVKIGPPGARTITSRSAASIIADSGNTLTQINEGAISPSGRYIAINNGSPEVVIWDTVTDRVSANWSTSGEYAHLCWSPGDVIVAPYFVDGDPRLMRTTVPPITTNGQTQPTEVTFSAGTTRSEANHVGGDRATTSAQRWVAGQALQKLGTWDAPDWTDEGGGRWSRPVTTNSGQQAGVGVTNVARVDGSGVYTATLARRTDTSLAVDEYHWHSGTSRLWVRLASGANPGAAIRPHMEDKVNGAFGLSLIPLDDAVTHRLAALHHSTQAVYAAQAQPHIAANREAVVYCTDHGAPSGASECMVAVFPT